MASLVHTLSGLRGGMSRDARSGLRTIPDDPSFPGRALGARSEGGVPVGPPAGYAP
jgi:hypothetical protein